MSKSKLIYTFSAVSFLLIISGWSATLLHAGPPATERNPHVSAGVETLPDEGRWHLEPGESWNYKSFPPTSGPHDPRWIRPGFYLTAQRPEKLVHSLEHGIVVIYYDRPAPKVLSVLKEWAERYPGKWDGVIVSPLPGLGAGVVLTAWRKRLRLEIFDQNQARSFLDAYRGHGPESGEKNMDW